jgi:hypothetical protein
MDLTTLGSLVLMGLSILLVSLRVVLVLVEIRRKRKR